MVQGCFKFTNILSESFNCN